jgi:hypothetical protein
VRPDLKVVLGRDREENQRLAGFESPQRWCLEPVGFTAPTALVCGARSEANIASAIELIVRYSRQAPDPVEVRWRDASGHAQQRVQALGRAAGALGASPVPAVLAPAAIEER